MNTDGKLDQQLQGLKGHAEESAGQALGDDDLVAHGKADQIAAHAKQAATHAGDAARQAGDAARHVGKRFKKRAMRRLGVLHERLHEEAAQARAEEDRPPEA